MKKEYQEVFPIEGDSVMLLIRRLFLNKFHQNNEIQARSDEAVPIDTNTSWDEMVVWDEVNIKTAFLYEGVIGMVSLSNIPYSRGYNDRIARNRDTE